VHWLKTPIVKIKETLNRYLKLSPLIGKFLYKNVFKQNINSYSREDHLIILSCFSLALYVTSVLVFTLFPLDALQLTLPTTTITKTEQNIVADVTFLHETLLSRVPQFEGIIFTKIAQFVLDTVHKEGTLSTFFESKILAFVLLGLLRVCFCFLFWLRIYVICGAVSVVWRYQTFSPFKGKDLLGLLSNGLHFDWGLTAIYNNVDEQGQPTLLLPSSVALPTSLASSSSRQNSQKKDQILEQAQNKNFEDSDIEDSRLYELLTEYGALCKTTRALTAYILAGSSLPSYLKKASKTNIDDVYETLPKYTNILLSAVLSAHRRIKFEKSTTDSDISKLEQYFISVLTIRHKTSIKELTPQLVATTILAILGARLLVYKITDGRYWTNTSYNPILSARSILYSIPEFSEDFSPLERALIRKSILYSAKLSSHSKRATSLEEQWESSLLALQQWTKLADGDPETLHQIANNLELYGLLNEVENEWQKAIASIIQKGDASFLNGTFLQGENYYLIPIRNMLDLVEDTLQYSKLSRIASLIESGYRLDLFSQENFANKQLKPLSIETIEYVTYEYEINEKDLSLWNSLRYVLQFYGWIVSSINNKKIGESALTSCIIKYRDVFSGSSELTLTLVKGLIPIRFKNFEKHGIYNLIENIPEAVSIEIIDDFSQSTHKSTLYSGLR
jgi:hypothetical protein